MAALKIVTVLALIALAAAQPTGGVGEIEGKVKDGGGAAWKGVKDQGEHWAGHGEKDFEDGAKGVVGHGGAGGVEGQIKGGAEAAFKAGKGFVDQGEHWAGQGEKACEDGAKNVEGKFEHGAGQFEHGVEQFGHGGKGGHGDKGGHGGIGGAAEVGFGAAIKAGTDFIGIGANIAKGFGGFIGF